ncbi:glycosyl transferase [Chytriomyces hyalinus]|nr:glycosyl transferase [Chytriomyces hyalinus]
MASLTSGPLALFAFAAVLKVLLFPSYHSTDFEVHRNWLAITHTLPLHKWYYEATSEWTLDYPPFFALFERTLAAIAELMGGHVDMTISQHARLDTHTLFFQRASVIVTEALFFYAATRFFKHMNKREQTIRVALVFCSPGLLFVDNIHFQYNGFLYGILLLSIHAMWENQFLLGGALFAITLNFKHIYLYQAPAYFVYILGAYCFVKVGDKYTFSLVRLIQMGLTVVAVFIASFGPFFQHLPQIMSRLFPFKRGLCHAYWAPNFWALYSFADRVAIQIVKSTGGDDTLGDVKSLTRGLVGNSVFAVLPDVTPLHTLVLTVLFQLPSLYLLWKKPTKAAFIDSLVLCGFSSFLFGWHVHEKAILLILIPFSIVAARTRRHAQIFYILSCVGTFSLFPLIFKATEAPTKVIVLLMFAILAHHYLAILTPTNTENLKKSSTTTTVTLGLSIIEKTYLYGLIPLFVYAELLHPVVFSRGQLEFLPLMMISVYCSVGVVYSFIVLSFLMK